MTIKTSRRAFLKQTGGAVAAAPFILTRPSFGAGGGKLRHASIGVGRRGEQDLQALITHPDIEIVALCDVDRNFLDQAAQRYPNARLYRDWRKLLKEEADRIDSVNVTIPNHMHAPVAMTALLMGKHVYCQKPLTHSLYEARRLAEESLRRPELVTQMGVQTHSAGAYRNAAAMMRSGVIGKIKEAHSWDLVRRHYTGAFTDPPMERRPDREDPIPETLDWGLWLGVAPERPYVDELYHPRMWRRWIDFGGGAHGDMAGHMMDVVFTGLELTAPKWVMSHRSPPFEETYSPNNKVQYRFPETPYTAGDIDYYWYDTGPVDREAWPLDASVELPGNGSMLVGEKGYLFVPHVGDPELLPRDEMKGKMEEYRDRHGWLEEQDHYRQFIDACLGRGATTTPFSYSGQLTESILMGTVVNRYPMEKLIWNAKELKFENKPEANRYLRRTYREGWKVEGLS
jgi:predicted dehydrogenase